MPLINKSFHNAIDKARASMDYTAATGWKYRPVYFTYSDRSVAYEFFTHFHPYVPDLIRRLNNGGFDQLQESDTVYLPVPNPNGSLPLSVIPKSTRATLLAAVTGTRPNNGPAVALTAGTPLTLADGVVVTVPNGTMVGKPDGSQLALAADTPVTLPGLLPVATSSGIQANVASGPIIVPDSTTVTLAAGGAAVLASDGSAVQLPAGTKVTVRAGLPMPYFFQDDFAARYAPDTAVAQPYPVKNLDFSVSGAYSIYNWELFFHAPLLIATHLSQNQKFQDAQNWFHYIFNPTDNSAGPTPQRFWKVAPFQYADVEMIEQILTNLAQPQDPQLLNDTVNSITAWQENPFQPWVVAKFRPVAYMLKTVMAYLDNLIDWGDSLFQQYTIETINEATQIYVMAANILGPRPQATPQKGTVKALTYNDLRKASLDPFGNAMVEMEADIPFELAPLSGSGGGLNGAQILPSIGKTLYFCIPRNDKMLAYWDTVADRLFKIHNSLNIQGVFQRLPLYDAPIDPALLVRAAAAGLDVSSIVGGLNQPLPLVRFTFLVAKASEICQEVKSLGANLLSAIEKRDNESITLLRAQHESAILGLTNVVRYAQWQEAQKATQGVRGTLDTAVERYSYYQKLLGRADSQIKASLPKLEALDLGSLQTLKFSQGDASGEPAMPLDGIDPNLASDSASVSDGEIKTLSKHEAEELDKLLSAHIAQMTASGVEALGAILALIPQFGGHVQPMGCGATIKFGGDNLSFSTSQLAAVARAVGEQFSFEANKAGRLGGYSRRELEWTFQSNTAKSEINQIFKQIRAAEIREAIAKKEYENHQVQMANAQQVNEFLQGNFVGAAYPNKENTVGFYALLKRNIKSLYAKSFQLAFEVARRAECAMQNELGDSSLSYIQFNYLDGNEGLLAGEKLMFDIKAMEMAYHDLNQREYEMTKHVSLRQVAPLALLQLRATGNCAFNIPEELFDLDGPGHYFRRLKTVAVTIPCVVGPYASVNCTLSLQKSSIRVSPSPGKTYARQGSDDARFHDYYGTMQAIVTSGAQSDSGLFETNLRDERYLPFENAGPASSQWQMSLPADVRQFDFNTITDVILHLRYTAREGGDALKAAAIQNLNSQIDKHQTVGSVSLFSLRHDFPTEWAQLQATSKLTLAFAPEFYPIWSQTRTITLSGIQFLAQNAQKPSLTMTGAGGKQDTLVRNPSLGSFLSGTLHNIALPAAVSDAAHPALSVTFDDVAMDDLWFAVTWGKK